MPHIYGYWNHPLWTTFIYFYILISQQWENGLAWRLSWLFNHDFMCTHLSPLLLVTTQELCHSLNDSGRIAKPPDLTKDSSTDLILVKCYLTTKIKVFSSQNWICFHLPSCKHPELRLQSNELWGPLIVAFIQQIPDILCTVDELWTENVVLHIPSKVFRCCNNQHIFGRHFPGV